MTVTKGRSTFTGVKKSGIDGLACEKCGRDDKAEMMEHFDCLEFYSNTFLCECGNIIKVATERDEVSKKYWRNR